MKSPQLIKSLQQYDVWLGLLFQGMEDKDPNGRYKFQAQIRSALEEKKSNYRGHEYINQLEKNLIYGSEATFIICELIARYLIFGEPRLGNDQEISGYIWESRCKALSETDHHLVFLQYGCNGCPVHQNHSRYQKLHNQREKGLDDKYLDEIEFCFQFYQATSHVAFITAFNILKTTEFSTIANSIAFQDLSIRTWHQVITRSNIWWQIEY